MESQLPNIVDEDGDVDLDNVDEPLIYQFVNIEMLKQAEIKDVVDAALELRCHVEQKWSA